MLSFSLWLSGGLFVSGAFVPVGFFPLLILQTGWRKRTLGVSFAISAPGERAPSGGWLLRHAIREIIAVFTKLTPVVAGNAQGGIPVVAATAAEDFAAVRFEVGGQRFLCSAGALVTWGMYWRARVGHEGSCARLTVGVCLLLCVVSCGGATAA